MTGADVLPAFQEGRLEEIGQYCANDVEQLRELCICLGEHEGVKEDDRHTF